MDRPVPPEKEGRPPPRSRPTHELTEHSLLSLKHTEGVTSSFNVRSDSGIFDTWLLRRLIWIEAESCRLNGGRICEHYIARAWAYFADFRANGLWIARYTAWFYVRTICAWLALLERGPQ